jgi:hypothetical protein
MAKSKTPIKPPSPAQKSRAGHGLATGRLSKNDTRSQSGRIEAEAAAVAKAKSSRKKKSS